MISFFPQSLLSSSLQKRYHTIFLLISFIILTAISAYIYYSYHLFQKNLYQKLEYCAESIKDELERGFDDNQALLKYLGEIVAKTSSHQNLEKMDQLLTSTGEFNIRSLATSYVSWANKQGEIIVSGKKGILHKNRINILTRKYFKTAKDNPWILQFSDVSQSLFSTKTVFPTALGVQSSSGEFLGYFVVGLRLKQLTSQLIKFIPTPDLYFLIFDRDLNLAISSDDFLRKEYIQLKKKTLTKPFKGLNFPSLGVEFKILKEFDRYPFIILTGYNKNKMLTDLIRDLLPSILQFMIMIFLVVLLLSLFKKKIIFPIHKLYESCISMSQGKKVEFPIFKIQELDKLSESLKFLSIVLEAYEVNQKKLEEKEIIETLSDKAKEQHLHSVYRTLNQSLTEIKLCILGLQELSSLKIYDQASQLLKAVDKKSDDILQAAFADNEKILFDIEVLLTECKMIYLKEACKNSITIEIIKSCPLPAYYGDYLKLKQIFLSIIGKCFQSVPEGGHIYIQIKALKTEHEQLIEIKITDNGFPEKTVQYIEKTLEIDKKFQLIGLKILSLEKIQEIILEEEGIFKISQDLAKREYILILKTNSLKFSTSKIINFKSFHKKETF